MGHNSVLFICNDAMDAVDRDPEGWWKTAWHHLNESDCLRGYTSSFGFGHNTNGFQAVWNRHADETAIIVVGQNMAQVVHTRYGSVGFHKADGQVKLLKEWAAELGYELRKADKKKVSQKLTRAEEGIKEFHPHEMGPRRWRRDFLASLIDHLKNLLGIG